MVCERSYKKRANTDVAFHLSPWRILGCRTLLQHFPILLVTDLMCRLGPIVARKLPGKIIEEGALPRVDDKVDIPALAAIGIHGKNEETGRGQPVPQVKCTQENVYNAFHDAQLDPPVQRGTDFAGLLRTSSTIAGRNGNPHGAVFANLAQALLHELYRKSRYSVDLVEVVAVLNARVTAVVAAVEKGLDEGDGFDEFQGELEQYRAYRDFSADVLTTAVGLLINRMPNLPQFYREVRQPEIKEFFAGLSTGLYPASRWLDAVMLSYSEVGVFLGYRC